MKLTRTFTDFIEDTNVFLSKKIIKILPCNWNRETISFGIHYFTY